MESFKRSIGYVKLLSELDLLKDPSSKSEAGDDDRMSTGDSNSLTEEILDDPLTKHKYGDLVFIRDLFKYLVMENWVYENYDFDKEKIIIISRATDKILKVIEDIVDKDVSDILIVLKSEILEKKSKLRAFFEKSKKTICIPFYEDNLQSLNLLATNFFKLKKKLDEIPETSNVIIDFSLFANFVP